MNNKKLDIKLRIAGKPYSLKIDAKEEEVYRLAEKRVNAAVTEYEKAHWDGYAAQDFLAIAALQFAVSGITLAKSREIGDSELKRLTALTEEIEKHLE